ncbi:sensor histidine kinase [Mucilaginibacter kameinonensis]|uniref:sensor histidine kinase n=1 Tax=Mucilaginibacter kameinonensis TaxID=452286 RepID=UPI000EF76054|nr:histidine kinase [Mucilaginibacter kameinonensis]
MKNRDIVFSHIVGWIVYILYELLSVAATAGLRGPLYHFPIYYLCYIGLFYFHAHVVLDYAFFRTGRPYIVSGVLIVLEASVFFICKAALDFVMPGMKKGLDVLLGEPYFLANLFREIFYIGFSSGYWAMRYMIRFKDRNHKMETEQLKNIASALELQNKYISVENAFLQNQISPHLLFNSLSFIYTSVRRLSDKAGRGVMLLSELMRYSLVTGDDAESVLLSREVEQIENLINLSRLRQEEHFYLQFGRKGRLAGKKVIPLLLITLVENAIKHGELGDRKMPVKISLVAVEDQLSFQTTNKIRVSSPYKKGGLGLKNLQKRLANAYPGRFTFDFGERDGLFIVSLKIIL